MLTVIELGMVDAARLWSRVDTSGDCWLWTGTGDRGGYGQLKIKGQTRMAHRLVYELLVGPIPKGLQLDHRCYVRKCVNPDHLNPVTTKQNMENHSGLLKNNTSGYRGVSWCKANGKWLAQVVHEGRKHHVGYHATAALAGEAAKQKRNELFTNNLLDRVDSSIRV